MTVDPEADVAATAPINPERLLSLVHPELRESAAAMIAAPKVSFDAASLAAARQGWPVPPEHPATVAPVLRRAIPGAEGHALGVEIIGQVTPGAARPAIVHMHGGGMVSGRAAHGTPYCQELAAHFDAIVVNVDYRRAPETPYPGPADDTLAAWRWLVGQADALGVDASRIALSGVSAGGGHAAILALRLAEIRGQQPCALVLIYPMLDDRTGSTAHPAWPIGTFGWTGQANAFGWSAFLGTPAGSAQVPTGAVPARAGRLEGLPPTFIGVGSLDLFVEENIAFARGLVRAGAPVALDVVPGAYHAFDFVVPDSRVSQRFRAGWQDWLARVFATPKQERAA